jgi:hypothetical protein
VAHQNANPRSLPVARYAGGNRDPHAMNSDSPGESEIISTRGVATIWYVFRVGQHKKERASG